MLGICSRGIKYWTWCHQFLTARAAPEVISLATKRLSFPIWVHFLRRLWSVWGEMKHFSNDIVICYHLTAECRASIRTSAAVLSSLVLQTINRRSITTTTISGFTFKTLCYKGTNQRWGRLCDCENRLWNQWIGCCTVPNLHPPHCPCGRQFCGIPCHISWRKVDIGSANGSSYPDWRREPVKTEKTSIKVFWLCAGCNL